MSKYSLRLSSFTQEKHLFYPTNRVQGNSGRSTVRHLPRSLLCLSGEIFEYFQCQEQLGMLKKHDRNKANRKQGHELQLKDYSTDGSDIILYDPETIVSKPEARWSSERILL
jgi:hypothetical protein